MTEDATKHIGVILPRTITTLMDEEKETKGVSLTHIVKNSLEKRYKKELQNGTLCKKS